MRWKTSLIVVMFSALAAIPGNGRLAQAGSLDGTPFEACPGYVAGHPIVSEIGWSAGCFLQAIHDRNKELVVAFAQGARCTATSSCDGVMDKSSAEFAFAAGKGGAKSKSLYELLSAGTSVLITYQQQGADIAVTFIPRPGPARDNVRRGWMKTFFECDFSFDLERGIWIVEPGLCNAESDVFTGSNEAAIDLNGSGVVLPYMVWTPGKQTTNARQK